MYVPLGPLIHNDTDAGLVDPSAIKVNQCCQMKLDHIGFDNIMFESVALVGLFYARQRSLHY